MQFVDLRSDTVTKPTPEMREKMAQAEVGDDVFGDDPTTNRLQEMAADMLGKQAALFVPSGTMGNLLALMTHCQRGEEVIVGDRSHIYLNEVGGMSALGGIHPYPVKNQADGTIEIEHLRASIRAEDIHHPVTRLICIENTQNVCGGVPLSVTYTQQVGDLARGHGLALHMDGARIFNAAIAQNVPVKELVAPVDSVMFCLSKGLAAPIGSMLVGSHAFIQRARYLRKMLGGGMRQVGIVAAAGIFALENMVTRLSEDHRRAKRLAAGLSRIKALEIDAGSPSTNMVYFNLSRDVGFDTAYVTEKVKDDGVLVSPEDARRFRLVTHYWIEDAGIEQAVAAFKRVLS